MTAALGRDPFLVDSSKLKKWPRPPDKRKKASKGKGAGGAGDLLATLRAAAVTRERRVKEISDKVRTIYFTHSLLFFLPLPFAFFYNL